MLNIKELINMSSEENLMEHLHENPWTEELVIHTTTFEIAWGTKNQGKLEIAISAETQDSKMNHKFIAKLKFKKITKHYGQLKLQTMS